MKNKVLMVVIIITIIIGVVIVINRQNQLKTETEGICFEFDETTKTITNYKETCEEEVVIPKKINNVEVEKIGNRAFASRELTKVYLPASIKEIGIGAFQNNQIKEIGLKEGIISIKAYAFNNNEIKNLNIPKSVTVIGIKAFNQNKINKKEAYIYQRNSDGSENKTILIGYGGEAKEIKIPEEVETIYLEALSGNELTKVTFNEKLERLESRSLSENLIEEIIIPRTVNYLGEDILAENPIKKVIIEGKKSLEEFNYIGENWNNGIEKIEFK